jgi:hypothetical protein
MLVGLGFIRRFDFYIVQGRDKSSVITHKNPVVPAPFFEKILLSPLGFPPYICQLTIYV